MFYYLPHVTNFQKFPPINGRGSVPDFSDSPINSWRGIVAEGLVVMHLSLKAVIKLRPHQTEWGLSYLDKSFILGLLGLVRPIQ